MEFDESLEELIQQGIIPGETVLSDLQTFVVKEHACLRTAEARVGEKQESIIDAAHGEMAKKIREVIESGQGNFSAEGDAYWIVQRVREAERKVKEMEDQIATVTGIDFVEGERLNFGISGEGAKLVAELVAGMFYQNGATNNLQIDLRDKAGDIFTLTIQKRGMKTTAEVQGEAIAAAEAKGFREATEKAVAIIRKRMCELPATLDLTYQHLESVGLKIAALLQPEEKKGEPK